jgi:hypothetical protein
LELEDCFAVNNQNMEEIALENFTVNEEQNYIAGKIINPKILLPGARIKTTDNTIEGYIYEAFEVTDLIQVHNRCPEIQFNIGEWYVKIKITKGIYLLLKKAFASLQIEEPEYLKPLKHKKVQTGSRSIYVKLRNMSGKHFSNFYIDVRGGSTNGAGRNEHGKAHFHIILCDSLQDLGAVYFPTVSEFKIINAELEFTGQIPNQMKREINKWVFADGLENLERLNCKWFEMNKDNQNRIIR